MAAKCFHGRARCGYCWPDGAVRRARRRCCCCGRFVKHSHPAPECPACIGRGFHAMQLPLAG